MAITRSVLGTSPNAIRWLVRGDTDDNVIISAATLIGELAEGPLKRVIEQANAAGDSAWTALAKANMAVGIYQGGSGATGAASVPGTSAQAAFTVVAAARSFSFIVITGASAVDCVLELRLIHSMVR